MSRARRAIRAPTNTRPAHSPRFRRLVAVTAAFAFAAAGIGVFIWQSSLLAFEPNRIKADARGDWLTAKAALDGIDAYQNPARLGRYYGVQYVAPGHPESGQGEHFRPPGALL